LYIWINNVLFKKKIFNYFIFILIVINIVNWGLGIGDWGLGIGDWGLGPIPKPQYPNPQPHNIKNK